MTFHGRIKASQCLITIPQQDSILIYNFLTQKALQCSTDALYWATNLTNWETLDGVLRRHSHLESASLASELGKLAEGTILIEEGSIQHRLEAQYHEHWEWGMAVGLYHFSVLNNVFLSEEESIRMQMEKAAMTPSPTLYSRHTVDSAHQLPPPSEKMEVNLINLMKSRRTNRVPGEPSILLQELSDCLYAGLAITGHVRTPSGTLPLQMTPAGGARNAYEAFVLVNWVEGIDAGIYHYSATQHSLSLVNSNLPTAVDALLAGQTWALNKPAIIFLVAQLERVMWKYQDPNGYRVVLIEAGHKGQNIALAATAHGLSACPTAALNHSMIAEYLHLDKITHTPIYALTLSRPGMYDFEIFDTESLFASS